jgi:hypothetical protein
MFLTAIYCFAIGVVANSYAYSDGQKYPTSSQEKFISDFSAKLFYHSSKSESSANNFNNLPDPKLKNPTAGFWATVKATEKLFETSFSQYTFFSRKILINSRKSDIIFPFHYFW